MNFLVRMVTALSAMASIKTLDFAFRFWRQEARERQIAAAAAQREDDREAKP